MLIQASLGIAYEMASGLWTPTQERHGTGFATEWVLPSPSWAIDQSTVRCEPWDGAAALSAERRSDRNALLAQRLDDGVVVEAKLLADGHARPSLGV